MLPQPHFHQSNANFFDFWKRKKKVWIMTIFFEMNDIFILNLSYRKKQSIWGRCYTYMETSQCQSFATQNNFIWLFSTSRSSRQEVLCKKSILKNFAKFTRKHVSESRFFPVKLAKNFKNTYLIKHLRLLLLYFVGALVLNGCYPANIYLFKVNNRSTTKKCQIYSKLTIKTPKGRQWCRSGVFIVNI